MSDSFSFAWEGRDYVVDLANVTAAEWRAIKLHTGIVAGAFLSATTNVRDLDGDAMMALLWLGQKHAGDPSPPFRDDLPVFGFLVALADGKKKADELAAATGSTDSQSTEGSGPKA